MPVHFPLSEFPQDVGRGGGVFDGREHGDLAAGRERVELLDRAGVAELVGPPPRHEVEARARHFLEEVPAAVGGAGELGDFRGGVGGAVEGCGVGGGGGGRCGGGRGGDGAEVGG